MHLADLARRGAHLLLGSTFVVLGYDALRTPGGRVAIASGTLDAIRRVVPLPKDDELLVRANAAAQTAGGAMLCVGVAPRLAAALIAASLVPTTVAGHAFWAATDPAVHKQQKVQFHKNLALIGGLLLVVLGDRRRARTSA